MACFVGLPVYWLLSPAIHRKEYHGWLVTAATVALIVRLGVLVAATPGVLLWPLLLLQAALDALCLPVVWLAAVEHMGSISSTAHAASGQVVVGTLYYTIGQGVGNLLWPRIRDSLCYGDTQIAYIVGISILVLNLLLHGPDRGKTDARSFIRYTVAVFKGKAVVHEAVSPSIANAQTV